jgi:hypothetical protein
MSDPNQTHFLIPLLSLAAGLALGYAHGLLDRRLRATTMRIRLLKSALIMLDRHHKGLAVLNDEDTPAEILDIAIRFAKLTQNPLTPKAIAYILSVNPDAFRMENKSQKEKWAAIAKSTRPDLLEAFSISSVAGIAAFVGRWPECRGAFDDFLVDFAASPVRETENVLVVVDKAISYLRVTRTAQAH